jgi:hypothetical protein
MKKYKELDLQIFEVFIASFVYLFLVQHKYNNKVLKIPCSFSVLNNSFIAENIFCYSFSSFFSTVLVFIDHWKTFCEFA